VSFIALWPQNIALKHCKTVSFYTGFCFASHAYGHEFWVMTKMILPQLQTTEMEFLRPVHCVTLRDKLCSCEIRQSLKCRTTPPPNLGIPAICFSHVSRMSHERLASLVLLVTFAGKSPRGHLRTRWSWSAFLARRSARPKECSDGFRAIGDVILSAPRVAAAALLQSTRVTTFPKLLGSALLRSQQNYLWLLNAVCCEACPPRTAAPVTLAWGKVDMKMNEWKFNYSFYCKNWSGDNLVL